MLKNLQVAAFNLQYLSHCWPEQNITWQVYVDIGLDVQYPCKILQN